MRRREFIGLLGAVASTWPIVARAQQSASNLPRVGAILTFRNENFEAFEIGLRDAGYIDRDNFLLEARFFEGAPDRLNAILRELVALNCSVIFAGNPYAIRAAVEMTRTIPIIGVDLESDPVASGFSQEHRSPRRQLYGILPGYSRAGG
jgi:putative ABC transport system substrate-binding protein